MTDGSEACDQLTGSTSLAVADPASDPLVTAVGGTQWSSLTPRSGETTWNSSNGASGGGISSLWTMPAWQSGPGVVNSHSSGKPCRAAGDCRETPDVSALAGAPYYAFYCSAGDCSDIGGWGEFYGTSFATPLWAASVALSNQSCTGKPPAGFLDPALYGFAASSTTDFHDVTTGDSDFTGNNGGDYPATASYDLATGLGTPTWSTLTPNQGLASSLCRSASLPSWPMFHQGPGHNGDQPLESTLSTTTVTGLHRHWNRGVGTSPIVLPERIYGGAPVELEVTSSTTMLTAYVGATGAPLWHFSYAPDGPVALSSAPAASAATGLIYVGFTGSSKHAIDAVHAATGKLAWRVPWPSSRSATCASAHSAIAGPLTVAGSLVFGQTTGGCVFALRATTGATAWVTDGTPAVSLRGETAPTEIAVSPTLSEVLVGTLYTGSPSSGRVVALNAANGRYLFSTDRCDSGGSTPARDGEVMLAIGSRGLCAMSISTGKIIWTNSCAANGLSSPAVSGGVAVALLAAGGDEVCAVSVNTGKLLWSQPVGASSSPATANGVVYLTSTKPPGAQPWGMLALDAASGAVLYASDAAVPVSSPAIVDGWVYTGASGFAP